MAQTIKKVILLGAGGLLGQHILSALRKEGVFDLSILARESSKAEFPAGVRVIRIGDDSPLSELIQAFQDQDAVVSAIPGRPFELHTRMIDAAVEAGVKRFVLSEYGNNTCPAASELVPLYADKAKTAAYVKGKESTGLTWTAIHTGQFFDWGIETGWLGYDMNERQVLMYDSGDTAWSTSTIGTAALAVPRVLLRPDETKNRAVHVASFTVSQRQVLAELEKASKSPWNIQHITAAEAYKRAHETDDADQSEALQLLCRMLLYSDDKDYVANFEKHGLLDNALLDLPTEYMPNVVQNLCKE